jgi:hypothetical protein
LFSCLITTPLAPRSPIRLYVLFFSFLPHFASLPSPFLLSPCSLLPHPFLFALPLPRPLHLFPPLLAHGQRQQLSPPRPSCAFLTFLIRPLVCSFVSFLSLFFSIRTTPPFTSNRLFDSSRHPVPCTNSFGLSDWSTTHLVRKPSLLSNLRPDCLSLPRLIVRLRHSPPPPFFGGRLGDVLPVCFGRLTVLPRVATRSFSAGTLCIFCHPPTLNFLLCDQIKVAFIASLT